MLTLESIRVIDAIARTGSFTAAAASLDRVPSALTYTVRQLEAELGVPLFRRHGRGARPTPAGETLLRQGRQLLVAADQMVDQVRRTAGGWESELRIAVNDILVIDRLRPMIEDFRQISPGTRLVFHHEVLAGAWEALSDDRADLVIAATSEGQPLAVTSDRIRTRPLGTVRFAYCMSPRHPLAAVAEPIPVDQLQAWCAITVADSSRRGEARSAGLLAGQPTITVATMAHKLALLRAGTGVGFLPTSVAHPSLQDGSLVARRVELRNPDQQAWFAWQQAHPGEGLAWWIGRLSVAIVQRRLLQDAPPR